LVADQGLRAREAQAQIHGQSDQLRQRAAILMGACLLLALLCAVTTVRMTTQLVHRMEQQAALMNQVSWHLLQSQEAAARRFSHELHDELGQSLAALKANLSTLQEVSSIDHDRLADCRNLVDEAVRNVRELSHLLRPTILDDFGLEAGLRWLSERFSYRTGIEGNFKASYFGRLPDATETHLFRIAQEALTNVSKHSKATRVHIELTAKEDLVTLLIRDNGVGIVRNASGAASGLGLIGMQARAQSAGGEMSMKTAPGEGVEILISIPRSPQPAEQPQVQVSQSEGFHEREKDAHPARG
jgi:signal transduction histidine kinase